MQEAGEIIGAVGHQLAAPDADEQIEKFALDRPGVGAPAASASAEMREAKRSGVAAQRGEPLEQLRIRRTRQQGRQQGVFLRAGEIDLVGAVGWLFSS